MDARAVQIFRDTPKERYAMRPVALVTGGTDGIGRAIVSHLAQAGYTVHILGRNVERGNQILSEVCEISEQEHRLFLVDLSSVQEVRTFLDKYTQEYAVLDLLILNALARTKKSHLTDEGLNQTFMVGCISRYMFSVLLSPLMANSEAPRVLHIGSGSTIADMDYDALSKPKIGMVKAMFQTYSGDALLAYFFHERKWTRIPHQIMFPGSVKTKQFKEVHYFPAFLLRLLGIIEPDECGERIVQHILSTQPEDIAGTFYHLEKREQIGKKLRHGGQQFDVLLAFCEKTTDIKISSMI